MCVFRYLGRPSSIRSWQVMAKNQYFWKFFKDLEILCPSAKNLHAIAEQDTILIFDGSNIISSFVAETPDGLPEKLSWLASNWNPIYARNVSKIAFAFFNNENYRLSQLSRPPLQSRLVFVLYLSILCYFLSSNSILHLLLLKWSYVLAIICPIEPFPSSYATDP